MASISYRLFLPDSETGDWGNLWISDSESKLLGLISQSLYSHIQDSLTCC